MYLWDVTRTVIEQLSLGVATQNCSPAYPWNTRDCQLR